MTDKNAVLSATVRERLGSRYASRARQQGRMPAVIYGHGETPVAVELDAKETLRYIHKGEKVFVVDLDNVGKHTVLLKDVQFDYLGTNIIHCDFARVNLDERVSTKVHVNLIGDAIGLKTVGTMMMHPVSEIEIECRVADLPDFVELDVSALDVGDSLSAGDITLPAADMKLLTDEKSLVAHVVHAMSGKTDEEEEVDTEGGAEPEVITEKKQEDDED